jgi:hypothetical protein
MPESADSRPTSSLEYVFMLQKTARAYYDAEAVRIEAISGTDLGLLRGRQFSDPERISYHAQSIKDRQDRGVNSRTAGSGTRARRNGDWLRESFEGLLCNSDGGPLAFLVNPQPFTAEYCKACGRYYDGCDKRLIRVENYKDEKGQKKQRRFCLCGHCDAWVSHYASFPERLVEPMILAGTSHAGCCPKCGAPWKRQTKISYVKSPVHGAGSVVGRHYETGANNWDGAGLPRLNKQVDTLGWRPSCPCDGEYTGTHARTDPQAAGRRMLGNVKARRDAGADHDNPFPAPVTVGWNRSCEHETEMIPCVVLDPFSGTGTVAVVAERLGRSAIGIEVNPDYVAMSRARLKSARREPVQKTDEALPLFREPECTQTK